MARATVAQLIPDGGPRPEWISRAKTKLKAVFADLVEAASRRGRRPRTAHDDRAPVLGAMLAVATRMLALSAVPVRRRVLQDKLVCAFDRVHTENGITARALCSHLALSERTFRAWQNRPAKPPPAPPPTPPSPPPNDRNTGRFDLGVTAPDTQLGGDATDLRVRGIELKLIGIQDLGDCERVLFEAFAVNERESSALIEACPCRCGGRPCRRAVHHGPGHALRRRGRPAGVRRDWRRARAPARGNADGESDR